MSIMQKITTPPLCMERTEEKSAEITMYGEVLERWPTNWDGNPVEGSYIALADFMDGLDALKDCTEITIRMDSLGGDCGVAFTIHNRLRELARDGVKLTCIVDGVAMSAASVIMAACDDVAVNPTSIVMIHKCSGILCGYYNSDELRKIAEQNDAYDQGIINAYRRKCSLSETVIAHMMKETTYMTGQEAVEKGFADRVLEDAKPLKIAASADGRSLICGGRSFRLPEPVKAPENQGVNPEKTPGHDNTLPQDNTSGQGGNTMTLAELKTQHPEAVAELTAELNAAAESQKASAAQAERQRLQAIDAIASQIDPALVDAAKYTDPCTAQELTYRAVSAAAKQGRTFLGNLEADNQASGAQNVSPAAPPKDNAGENTPKTMMDQAAADVKRLLGK